MPLMIPRSQEPERGFVLAVLAQGADPDEELAEVEELARTAGVEPVGRVVQHRARPAQRTYVGKGKLEELEAALRRGRRREPARRRRARPGAAALPRGHARRARDRPHAADPRHLRPARRQRRGEAPGRARAARVQPAADARDVAAPRAARRRRRHARPRRVAARDRPPARAPPRLRAQEAPDRASSGSATTRRKERRRTQVPTIALAGYTNVGKSTLLNALTGAEVSVENRLFETLDPTTRGFEHDGRRYLVTDTVGFIRRLPHQLVEGFAATLEETLVADLVLHVADASARRRPARRAWSRAVEDVLDEIGAAELPVQLVLNKIDRVDEIGRRRLENRFPDAPQVSAATGEGLEELKASDRRAVRVPLRDACACSCPVRRGRPALRALRARSADRVARGHPRRRARRRAAAAARPPAVRAVPDRRRGPPGDRLIELPIRRLRDEAVLPARAYSGDAGLDLSACERVELGAGRARARPDRARRRDPRGLRRLRPAAFGPRVEARDLDRQHARARRLRLPRRAAGQPPQHRPARGVRRRAGDADRPARRARDARRSSSSRSTSCPTRSAASAASDRRRH